MAEYNSLRDYLHEIGAYDLLTAEREAELGVLKNDSDPAIAKAARDELICHNLRLVVNIAKAYKNAHLTLQDLIAEGNAGLITAVDKYDVNITNPTTGKPYRFSTCATPWIKQAILKAITDKGKSIRLPAHVYQLMNKYKKAIGQLTASGEEVTDEKLAKMLGIEVEKIAQLRSLKHDTVSLSTPLTDEDGGDTLEDLQADNDETPVQYTERTMEQDRIAAALKHLDERTQRIMKMRYGLGQPGDAPECFEEHTLEEIGNILGLTRERIRQIEKKALADLRPYLE